MLPYLTFPGFEKIFSKIATTYEDLELECLQHHGPSAYLRFFPMELAN